MKKKKLLFHQDNVGCHKLITMMAKLHVLHFELFLYLPYSPDLSPSNYWLFADLKRMLQGKRFGSNEEVILETEAYFVAKDKIILQKGQWIVREVLKSVYYHRRRLCWWIKSNFAQKLLFYKLGLGLIESCARTCMCMGLVFSYCDKNQ